MVQIISDKVRVFGKNKIAADVGPLIIFGAIFFSIFVLIEMGSLHAKAPEIQKALCPGALLV